MLLFFSSIYSGGICLNCLAPYSHSFALLFTQRSVGEGDRHTHTCAESSKMSHMYQSTAEPHKQPLRFRVVLQSRRSGYRERERERGGGAKVITNASC